jgi:glycosyltransferase involved in cell wall biosynthesis
VETTGREGPRLKLNFYLESPSLHQLATLRALRDECDCDVRLFVEKLELPERVRMGWTKPDSGSIPVRVLDTRAAAGEAVLSSDPSTVHLSSGWSAYPLVAEVTRVALNERRRIGINAESLAGYGWRGPARRLKSAFQMRTLGRRVDFLLASGQLGVRWYRAAGFRGPCLFPFGYFVEPPGINEPRVAERTTGEFQFLYVGTMSHTKGPDLMLRALRRLEPSGWSLDVIGDGPLRTTCEGLAEEFGLAKMIRFHGYLPRETVLRAMWNADALVVPSRWDGWSVVINEALMRGLPVICSSTCGAADLVPGRGEVFEAGDVEALGVALQEALSNGPPGSAMRSEIIEWSARLHPSVAARYLRDVVRHVYEGGVRPSSPWA